MELVDYTSVPEHMVLTWSPQRTHKLPRSSKTRKRKLYNHELLAEHRIKNGHSINYVAKNIDCVHRTITSIEAGNNLRSTIPLMLRLYSYYGSMIDADIIDPHPGSFNCERLLKAYDTFCMYCLDMDEKEAARKVINENRDMKEFKNVRFI